MKMDSLWSNVFKSRDGESEEAMAIKNVPVFDNLSAKELKDVEKVVHKRDYNKSENIFREGDPGGGMYIILHGEVDIIKGEEPGATEVLATLKEGDFFGEIALLDESPRTASAVSKTASVILGFYRTDLQEFVDRKPKLAVNIIKNLARVLAERLRFSNYQTHELRLKLSELETPANNR